MGDWCISSDSRTRKPSSEQVASAWLAGKPTVKEPPKRAVYSRETLLELCRTDLPLPPNFDTLVEAYNEEAREPLAFLPLSEIEKKRPFARDPKKPFEKPFRKDWKEKEEEKEEKDDLWDMPTDVGAFGSDGVFGDLSPVLSKRKVTSQDSLTEDVDASPRKATPGDTPAVTPLMYSKPVASPGHVYPKPVASPGEQVYAKPIASPLAAERQSPQHSPRGKSLTHPSPIGAESLPMRPAAVSQTAPHDPFFGTPILGDMRQPLYQTPFPMMQQHVNEFNPPPFSFIPPQWVYRDPTGKNQGPFTPDQMNSWFKEGYFPAELPIKRLDDPTYVTLHQFISKYGPASPFLDSATEQEQQEKMAYLAHVNRMRMMHSQPAPGFAQPGYSQAPGFAQAPGFSQAPGFASHAPGFSQAPGFQNVGRLPGFGVNEPLLSSPAFGNRPNVRTATPESSPVQKPTGTPKTSKYVELSMTSNLDNMRLASQQASPIFEQPKSESLLESFSKLKRDDPVISRPQVQAPAAVRHVVEPVQAPQPQVAPRHVVQPVQAPQPQVAPWTKPNENKHSLRDIQEAEAKEAAKREQESRARAEQAMARDLSRVAQAQAEAHTPAIGQSSSWGKPQAAVSSSSKTLAQIMDDEAKSKHQVEAKRNAERGAAPAGLRYADSIAKSRPNVVSSSSGRAPAVIATGPLLKPLLVSSIPQQNGSADAWQTVGKNSSKTSLSSRSSVISLPGPGAIKNLSDSSMLVWARTTLKSLQRTGSAPFNVEEFIGILMSIPIKESSTITMICDDTLGGYTAVDPRKFADEFVKRRQLEGLSSKQLMPTPPVVAAPVVSKVPAKVAGPDMGNFTDNNRFEVVQKKKNKKKN